MEVSKVLKISMVRFTDLVTDGSLPKGRIGEDGRRYYTRKDVDFILREWKTQTTGRFLMYTLPLMLVLVFLLVMTIMEINDKIRERQMKPTPAPPSGYGAPPPQFYDPGTPWPTPTVSSSPTPKYTKVEDYRRDMQERNRQREMQRRSQRSRDRRPLYHPE